MNEIINTITDGLFSVFVSLGSIPIIRCPKGNAAEFVAEVKIILTLVSVVNDLKVFCKILKRLDKKIRENLRDARNSLFLSDTMNQSGQLSFQRPLLILLDRNFDLATPLHHTWTYQALLHDVFDLDLNRVELEKSQLSTGKEATKKYDLINTDKFWRQQKGNPFPVVAESVQEELEKFKQCDGEIKSLKDSIVILVR